MPGPKADRLALLRATRTQLSPILAVYFDRSERYRHVMSRAWSDEWRARDDDGILHQLSAFEPDDRLLAFLERQILYVADGTIATRPPWPTRPRSGHRRACARRAGRAEADWIMVMLVNAELTELEIRPPIASCSTPRKVLCRRSPAATTLFRGDRVEPEELAAALAERRSAEPTFGLVLPHGDAVLLIGDRDGLAARLRRERMSPRSASWTSRRCTWRCSGTGSGSRPPTSPEAPGWPTLGTRPTRSPAWRAGGGRGDPRAADAPRAACRRGHGR